MPMIFVSYSHLDRKWFDRGHPFNLIPWLENALRRDGVTLWYDRSDEAGLQPGDRFEQEITQAIGQADVALLLISEAFFSSDFIRTVELPRILARAEGGEMVVIPVLLEPCDWQSFDFVAARQMLPGGPTPLIDYTESERQWAHARDEILSGIRRRIRSVPPTVVAPSPVPRPLTALPKWVWVALFLALAVLAGRAWIWPLVRPTVKPTPTQIAQGQQTPAATAVQATRPPAATPAPAPSRTQALASTATLVPSAVAGTPVQAVATKVLGPSGITMVYVPAGEFLMGSADADPEAPSNEKPQHTVYLDAYWIGQTEVTNAQLGKFIDAGGYSTREYWTDEGWAWKETQGITQPLLWTDQQWNKPDYPVVGVSWYEAAAYAKWAGARLPTEAEWEKAARGTDGRIYPWGNEWDGNRLNFCDKNCEGSAKDTTVDDGYAYTAPVGHYPSGASPYGALDVAGNVWEWAADWYDLNYYSRSPNANPQGPASGSRRVPRGGSWPDDREILRCAFRMWDGLGSDVRAKDIGFRVAGASSPLAGVAQPTLVPTGLVTQAPTSSPLPSATRTPARTDTPKPSATPVVSAVGTTPVQPVATKVLEPSGITMVYVPAGEFLMGSADSDTQAQSDEKPQHKVYLDGYWIGQTEVTNAQFARFITAGGYSNREYWTDDGWEWKRGVKEKAQPAFWTDGKMNEPDYPVTGVSWFEAAAYAKWAGVHLPTEAEWEKAARGTMALIYPWGNEWAEKRANTTEARLGGLSAVGSFLAGASPYGALDMAGSVWEWVADWYDGEYYAYSPANNPIGPVYGRGGVVRGGAWYYDRGSARCACRGWHLQGLRFYYVGFRVAE